MTTPPEGENQTPEAEATQTAESEAQVEGGTGGEEVSSEEDETKESLRDVMQDTRDLKEEMKDKVSPGAEEQSKAVKALRPEVIHADHHPPPAAIQDFIDSEAEKAKEPVDIAAPTFPHPKVEELTEELTKATIEERDHLQALSDARDFESKSMQEAAELHENYPTVHPDPVAPPPVESSAPDTAAQGQALAEAAAAPLRKDVTENARYDELNSSQHQVAAAAASAGEPYPAPEPDHLAAREEETAGEVERAEAEAGKHTEALKGRRTGLFDENTPDPPHAALLEDPDVGHLVVETSAPWTGGLGPNSLVSRMDHAHGEIGVVKKVDNSNQTHPLVLVEFPEAGESWLPIANLRHEGRAEDLVTS